MNAFSGTWFQDLDIAAWQAIGCIYHFATGECVWKAAKKLKMTSEQTKHWYDKCQQAAQFNLKMCSLTVDDQLHYLRHQYQACPKFIIGGQDKIVEVDLAPMGVIFTDQWGLAIIEKDTWKCYVLPIKDASLDTIGRALKGRVMEGSRVLCNFVEASSNKMSGMFYNFSYSSYLNFFSTLFDFKFLVDFHTQTTQTLQKFENLF
jgi:hypothetical protein